MDTISLLSWGLALQGTRALEGSLLPAVRVTPGFVELVFLMEAGPVGGTEGRWGSSSVGQVLFREHLLGKSGSLCHVPPLC